MKNTVHTTLKNLGFFNLAVWVGSLGYFVDIFDLFLFSSLRVPSLHSLGVPAQEVLSSGIFLMNLQMMGLVLGGVFWGVLADRLGRRRALVASILLYSLANLANALIQNVTHYAILRFVAGFGLAGELGAAITLVNESLSPRQRGWGTTWVACFGLLGGAASAWVSQWMPWRSAYILGGVMGLLLLLVRLPVQESQLFQAIKKTRVSRGDLRLFFASRKRVFQVLSYVALGVPVYFVSGILIFLAPEFAQVFGVQGSVSASQAVFYSYLGTTLGDLLCGVMSQRMKSRKKAVLITLGFYGAVLVLYFSQRGWSEQQFYFVCVLLGLSTGYWTVLLSWMTEQFGTNLRATVSTSVPNLIRGSVIPLSFGLQLLQGPFSLKGAALVLGVVVLGLAWKLAHSLEETYGRSLEFLESA